jgi:Acyl-CoA carboxylase epsilon subunit
MSSVEQSVESADGDAVDIRIQHGDPTPVELAAVTAVLTGALDEIAGEQRRRQSPGPSAWHRSQRAVRVPVVRGAWSTSER